MSEFSLLRSFNRAEMNVGSIWSRKLCLDLLYPANFRFETMKILALTPLLLLSVVFWPRHPVVSSPAPAGLEEVGPTVLMNLRDRGEAQILDLRSVGRVVPGASKSWHPNGQTPVLVGEVQTCREKARQLKINSGFIVAPRFIEFEFLPGVPQIAPREAKRCGWPIFDVSEQSEFDLRRIRGSQRLDYTNLQAGRWDNLQRSKPFIVACRVGHRSQLAVRMLRKSGFRAVNLTGGMWEWEAQNLPLDGKAVK